MKDTITIKQTLTYELDFDTFKECFSDIIDMKKPDGLNLEQAIIDTWDKLYNDNDETIELDDNIDGLEWYVARDDVAVMAESVMEELFECCQCHEKAVGNYGDGNEPYCQKHKDENDKDDETDKTDDETDKTDEVKPDEMAIPLPAEPKDKNDKIVDFEEERKKKRRDAYNNLDDYSKEETAFKMSFLREDYEFYKSPMGWTDDFPIENVQTFWEYVEVLRVRHNIEDKNFWEKWVKYHQMIQEDNDMGDVLVLEWDVRELCWIQAETNDDNEFSEVDSVIIRNKNA